jgi:hypothetical protein
MIILTYWLPFCRIETKPIGKAKLSNILAQVTLIRPKLIDQIEYYIPPAIPLLMNYYALATADYFCIIFL